MEQEISIKYLNIKEFHLDTLGRIVINDPEIVRAIKGRWEVLVAWVEEKKYPLTEDNIKQANND